MRGPAGVPGHGPVGVLVGIHGSPESAATSAAALELLGDRMFGRATSGRGRLWQAASVGSAVA